MTEGTEASGPNPDEVFTLLAERARVKIIEALGDAATPGRPARLSFSELRRRADISGSGRFNYHLKRLVGRFVEETDGGYRLSYPGVRVYRAIRAGTFTDSHRIDPFELDATCHVCGGPQEAAYHDCLFRVRCGGDCEAVFYRYFCPPNSLADQDRAAILRAVSERIRREIGSMASGVCPWCCGAIDTRVSSPDDGDDNPAIDHRVRHACGTCGGTVYTRPGDLLTTHPAVVSFFLSPRRRRDEPPCLATPLCRVRRANDCHIERSLARDGSGRVCGRNARAPAGRGGVGDRGSALVDPTDGTLGQSRVLYVGRQTAVVAEPAVRHPIAVGGGLDVHRLVGSHVTATVRAVGHG